MSEWKSKLGSVVTSLLGALIMLQGLKADTSWAEVPALFTPLAVVGLLIILWRAWQGTGQMKLPAVKRPGKRP